MGTLVATYACAAIIVLASLLVGRALLLVLGRREATFLEGAVGVAVLLVVCSVAIRLPGNDVTALLAAGVLVIGSLIFLLVRDEAMLGPAVGIGLPVAALAALLASLPFIASGHIGIPGVGLNNDMAEHLVDTDYLLNPVGPKPSGIVSGYPIGAQSVAGSVASLLGTEPLNGFFGLFIAVPVLIAITSLSVLRELPADRRILAAGLVSVAYLTASVLGISGFKELLAALFLIGFALGLREIERGEEGLMAIVAGLAAMTIAMVSVYSLPGLAWIGVTAGAWVIGELALAAIEGPPGEVSRLIRRSLRIVAPAAVLLFAFGLAQLPRVIDFIQSGAVGTVRDTNSKLRYVVSPLEGLGIWPSGNWLLGTSDVSHYWVFGIVGLAGLVFGLVWWLRKRDLALPAALVAGVLVFLYAKTSGGLYVQAKAVVVPASLIMLIVLSALFAPGGGWLRRGFAVLFVGLAAYSSFLALRDTVVAPNDRSNELTDFRSEIAGKTVLSLNSDRFADYWLRGASQVWSPGFNAENRVASQVTKSQRLPIDFDSVPTEVLNQFPYAVTTSAVYQSQAPPGWQLVDSTDSYKLWKRVGQTPQLAVVYEEARPGRVFRCKNSKLHAFISGGGDALVWPRPVIAKRLYWKTGTTPETDVAALKQHPPSDNQLAPGEESSQAIKLPPGRWQISFQYVSPVTGLTVTAPGLDAHLPAGVEAAIPYRPDQGPYWPVGEVTSKGGPVTFTVRADDVNSLQSLLGVDAPAVLGNLTAVQTEGFRNVPIAQSCGLYIDHIVGAPQQRNTKQ